jgi:hypothetical protein
VSQAGGDRPDADLDAINLADFLRDGEQIRLPTRSRVPRPATAASVSVSPPRSASVLPRPSAIVAPGAPSPQRTLGRYPGRSLAADVVPHRPGGPINVNTASAAELNNPAQDMLQYDISQSSDPCGGPSSAA